MLQRFQIVGGVLEFLVLHQLANQFPARILVIVIVIPLHLLLHRQQFLTLDIHQRAGHHQKLAGNLDVKLPHQVHVLDELPRDLREVHIIYIHLLLLHQI